MLLYIAALRSLYIQTSCIVIVPCYFASPVRREDSEGDNYILWRGDSLNSQDDDFSRWNCSSVNEVLQKYHTVKIKETYFPMM